MRSARLTYLPLPSAGKEGWAGRRAGASVAALCLAEETYCAVPMPLEAAGIWPSLDGFGPDPFRGLAEETYCVVPGAAGHSRHLAPCWKGEVPIRSVGWPKKLTEPCPVPLDTAGIWPLLEGFGPDLCSADWPKKPSGCAGDAGGHGGGSGRRALASGAR